MKAVTVLCILLFQCPHSRAKPRERASCLSQRLELWLEGQVGELLLKGHSIQQHLYSRSLKPRVESKLVCTFTNMMLQGKTKATIHLLTADGQGEVLQLDAFTSDGRIVLEILRSKHPFPQSYSVSALQHPNLDPPVIHPVFYEAIDAHCIRSAALHTFGAGGPSGTDAACWRRLCTSFKKSSDNMCHSIALASTNLCSSFVVSQSISPLLACAIWWLFLKTVVYTVRLLDESLLRQSLLSPGWITSKQLVPSNCVLVT